LIIDFDHGHKEHNWGCLPEGSACLGQAHLISLSLWDLVWKISSYPRMLDSLGCMIAFT
jgi:hypothetical protein